MDFSLDSNLELVPTLLDSNLELVSQRLGLKGLGELRELKGLRELKDWK